MARRSKHSTSPGWVALLIVLGIGATILAVLLIGERSEPYRTTDTLDTATYLENANSLRGNVYRMEAEVLNALAMSRSQGRLISVKAGDDRVVPVIIPPEFNDVNIQRGQRFFFMVEVDDQGLLRVRELTKS